MEQATHCLFSQASFGCQALGDGESGGVACANLSFAVMRTPPTTMILHQSYDQTWPIRHINRPPSLQPRHSHPGGVWSTTANAQHDILMTTTSVSCCQCLSMNKIHKKFGENNQKKQNRSAHGTTEIRVLLAHSDCLTMLMPVHVHVAQSMDLLNTWS